MKNKYKEKFSLEGKKVFLIGPGLIGLEVCKALSECGAEVLVMDRSITSFERFFKENENKRIRFSTFDVTELETIERNLEGLFKEYFVPEIYINCSYPTTEDWISSDFEKIQLSSLNKNLSFQLTSPIWIARLVAEKLKKQSVKGSLIFMNSIYGIQGQDESIYSGTEMKENMIYPAIKGGITNFTRQMASHYSKHGIRINSVCAGGVEGHVKGAAKQDPVFKKNYSKKVPIGRLAKPEEISSAILFLASDLSSYVTGTNLVVDGGWSAI